MRQLQRGFTLLEIMVVLMIIGLLMSMVNLNFTDRAAQRETETLARQIEAAFNRYREEAVFQNIDLGVAWLPEEFLLLAFYDLRLSSVTSGMSEEQVSQLEDNPWAESDINLIQSIPLPENIRITLEVSGEELPQAEDPDDIGPEPGLVFLSSDEYLPFSMHFEHLEDDSFTVVVMGDGIGPVVRRLEQRDE